MAGTGVQNVSLNAPNDYLAQQMQIQRAQQLAQALAQQGNQDIPVMSGGGAPAPIAWTSMLSLVANLHVTSACLNNLNNSSSSPQASNNTDRLGPISSHLPNFPKQKPQPNGVSCNSPAFVFAEVLANRGRRRSIKGVFMIARRYVPVRSFDNKRRMVFFCKAFPPAPPRTT